MRRNGFCLPDPACTSFTMWAGSVAILSPFPHPQNVRAWPEAAIGLWVKAVSAEFWAHSGHSYAVLLPMQQTACCYSFSRPLRVTCQVLDREDMKVKMTWSCPRKAYSWVCPLGLMLSWPRSYSMSETGSKRFDSLLVGAEVVTQMCCNSCLPFFTLRTNSLTCTTWSVLE